MRKTVAAFWRSCEGATSIEYAIIATGLSIAIVAGANAIGLNLNNLFFTKVQAGFS